MKLTVKELYIDGVQVCTPRVGNGLTISENKIWSANTGRLENTGEMAGTIVAIKQKIDIKWPEMSMEECAEIHALISSLSPFHTLKYTDMTGSVQELSVYFGDPTYTINAYSEGVQRVKDVAVSAIEK